MKGGGTASEIAEGFISEGGEGPRGGRRVCGRKFQVRQTTLCQSPTIGASARLKRERHDEGSSPRTETLMQGHSSATAGAGGARGRSQGLWRPRGLRMRGGEWHGCETAKTVAKHFRRREGIIVEVGPTSERGLDRDLPARCPTPSRGAEGGESEDRP